jgi:hypothetical protein
MKGMPWVEADPHEPALNPHSEVCVIHPSLSLEITFLAQPCFLDAELIGL